MEIPDVDIDVPDRNAVLDLFPEALCASQLSTDKGKLVQHNTGVYFQKPPVDPLNGLVTYPYDMAEELGYYKIDFIPFHIYENINSEEELQDMIDTAESDDFPWDIFSEKMFFENSDAKLKLTHLGSYFDLCQTYPPKSVMDIAILIALIRPRKKYLIGETWDTISEKIWLKLPEEDKKDNYFFKKSHAVGYALAVLVHIQVLDKIL